MLLVLITFFTIPNVSALVTQFEVNQELDNGDRATTQVMVSEVSYEELDWKLAEFKSFLKTEENIPLKFVYASPSEKLLDKKKWKSIIGEDDITSRLQDLNLSDATRVEIPDEWFENEGRSPQSDPSISMASEFERYYAKKFKVKRITLVASRTLLNGAIAAVGFIAGGVPVGPAMVIGSVTGLLSGYTQLISSQLLDFLDTNKYEVKLRKLLGMKPVAQKSSKFLASQFKWWTTEVAFMAILDIARFSMGVLPATTMANESLQLSLTALKSLASQGLIDTALAKDLGPKIRAAIEAGDFQKAAKYRFRNEIVGFSSSMVWAGAAITDMMGLPISNVLFGSMAAYGGTHHLKLILKDRIHHIGNFFISACNWLFSAIRPSKPISSL